MKYFARSVIWLLPLFVCACGHKTNISQIQQPLAPPIEDTPPPKTEAAAVPLSPPTAVKFPAPPPPKVVEGPKEPPKRPRTKKPATKNPPVIAAPAPGSSAAPSNPQVASNETPAPPGEISAVGTLSTGEADNQKKEALNDINQVEKGLSGITRKLSENEVKTSSQIKEYLKQAINVLNTGDVDGAKNLTMKAKVLLSELSQ